MKISLLSEFLLSEINKRRVLEYYNHYQTIHSALLGTHKCLTFKKKWEWSDISYDFRAPNSLFTLQRNGRKKGDFSSLAFPSEFFGI